MAMGTNARLGEQIRRRRERRGLSQAQLAERVGISRTTVTMIEGGGQSMSVQQLLEIAAALRIDPGNILNELVQSVEPAQTEHPSEIETLLTELDTPVTRITF